MSETIWREGLDSAQLAAVVHPDSPLVIVAGAGTGKTQTMTARVADLLARGVVPERILLVTFTRRAAAEMTARVAGLVGDQGAARRIWAGTFHAVAHRLVVEHREVLGLGAVSVLDPADVVDLLDVMRDEVGLSGTRVRLPGAQALADILSRTVNTGRAARDVITADFPQHAHCTPQIMALLSAVMARKRTAGLLDFDDLLLAWRALLGDPVVGNRLRARWDHVLVDEYQDVNQIQVDIITAQRPDGTGLTVVGDDAQAVYGFRGASSSHLLSLAGTYPDATVVRLERNFRSVQPILDLANVVRPVDADGCRLRLHANRSEAESGLPVLRVCYDSAEQATAVADAVLAAHEDGVPLRAQAVLMRAAVHSRELEIELAARRVPYVKYGGLRYIETAHVKDLLSALRLTTNPRDEVGWFRLLKMHRGIGRSHARELTGLLTAQPSTTADRPSADVTWDELEGRVNEALAIAPPRARPSLEATLSGLTAAAHASHVGDLVQVCLNVVTPLVRGCYDNWALRLDDLDQLAAAARGSTNVAEFVAALTLDPASVISDYAKPPHIDDDYIVLSTVHSAKGLEWERVHLIHATDGAFPSDMALSDDDGLAEEQRLFYVALTRARDNLVVYSPRRIHTTPGNGSDRHVYTQPSRFLTPEAMAALHTIQQPEHTKGRMELESGRRVEIPALADLFT